jgi:formylglycine-generating enzyme required for sulfatase activity
MRPDFRRCPSGAASGVALGPALALALALSVTLPVALPATAQTGASTFHILTPCRIFDTRLVGTQTTGQPLPGSGSPDSTFVLTGGSCFVPADAVAISANVTVTQPAATGSISVYPGGGSPGETTTESFAAGKTRANNAILKLSTSGDGTVGIRNRTTGTAHVIVDVNGYFLDSASEITVSLPNLPAGAKPLVLRRIPAGTFNMGAPDTELNSQTSERPVHQVTLTQDYYLGKYEVTQAQWQAVTGTAMLTQCGSYGVGNDYPVYCVSWDDIAGSGGFIEKLRTLTGDARFRLPTEAEWERAARAGTQTRFSFGDALDSDDGCGASAAANPYVWWCGNNTPYGSKPVGTKLANQLGLFDLHGNAYEWVQDRYASDYYSVSPSSDPTGPSWGSYRVTRGGCWASDLQYTRSAFRNLGDLTSRGSGVGFRLSRSQ